MSSRLQLDVRNLSLARRYLVNAYEVNAGIGAGNTVIVWYVTERFESEVQYINTLLFLICMSWTITGQPRNSVFRV